jgi:hypothetical protein
MQHRLSLMLSIGIAIGIAAPPGHGSNGATDGGGAELFEKKVLPILVESCYGCHSEQAGKKKGGLWLDRRSAMLAGGKTGPAVVPGDLDKSLLVEAIRWQNTDMQMPPEDKLPDDAIAVLEQWIKAGALAPREDKDIGKDGKPKATSP